MRDLSRLACTMGTIFFRSHIFAKVLLAMLSCGLLSAYIMEYYFGVLPCSLCLYQRYLTILALIVVLPTTIVAKSPKKLLVCFTSVLLIIVSIIIFAMLWLACYHLGVEYGIFQLPQSCVDKLMYVIDITQLNDVMPELPVACDRPSFFLGVRVSIWTLLSVLLLHFYMAVYWIVRRM